MKSFRRVAALAAFLVWCTCISGGWGDETFPTTVATEASVSSTELPDVWVSLDVYSEQPFLYNSAAKTIYTHPQMPFGAEVDSFEFDGEDDPRVFQKRQIFGYSSYQPTATLSDGVSDVASAFYPYERVDGVVFWKTGTLNRTFPTRIYYETLHVGVQCRTSDGTIVTTAYPVMVVPLQEWTSVSDFLNAKYEISLCYYQPGQPTVPVPDTEARVGFFHVNYPTQTLLYATPWATTNAAGRADSTMGTGTYTIPISGNVPLDKVTIRINPLTEDGTAASNAYVEKELVIDNMATFDGELTVTVMDVDDTPLRAWVTCTGGPVGLGDAPTDKTDTSGEVTLRIPKYGTGTDTRSVDVHLAPKVLIVSDLTQFIDGIADGELHAKSPAYFSPHFQLMEGAYTYKNKAPSDPLVRIYVDGTQEGGDFDSQTIKRDEDYSLGERLKGVNRLFYPVTPGATPHDYTCRVYFEDDDEGAQEDEMQAGHTKYTPRTVREARVPESDSPLHFQYVGVIGPGTPRSGSGTALSRHLPAAQQADWNAFVQKFVPCDVVFTNGPDVTPDTWFFEFDGYRIGGIFRELNNWRRSQTTHIDVVVGILAPGGASSFLTGGASGLSLPGYAHVVLIDPSGGLSSKSHILLHEYLHTLGQPDKLNAPASANGYDPDTGRPVYNGGGIQTAQSIMFDAATQAWPTRDEYETLLDNLTLPLASLRSDATKATTVTRVMQISAMLHRVPSDTLIGAWEVQVARRAPVFIETGVPYAPQEAPPNNGMNGRAYGVTLTDNVTFSDRYYHLLTTPTINDEDDPPLHDDLLGFIDFSVPWNDDTSSIGFGSFDYSGAMSGIVHGCEIERSATAPTVSWTSKPADGATLSDRVVLEWQTDDPDYKPTLYAWVKISTDDGATWRAAENYFPIEEGITSFTLDCDLFPSCSACRLKVLVTDDWYTQVLEAGPYALDGYDPNPVASPVATSYTATVRAPAIVTFPLAVANTGRSELTLDLTTETLPAWLDLVGAKLSRRVVAGSEDAFFFSCASTITQTLSGTVTMVTNDPNHASLAFPVSVTFDDQDHAPEALWLKAWGLADGARTPSPESIVFLAQEATGRSDLEAKLTIRQRLPFDRAVATDVVMSPGQRPGEYRLDWTPEPLETGLYGVELSLTDSTSALSDEDGTNPSGDDFTFEIVGENHAPVFSSVSPRTDATSYTTVLGGDNFTLYFSVSDPDGDPISFSLDCEMPCEIDSASGTISGLASTNAVGKQTVRLVATDPNGAQSTAVWYVDVEPPWVPDIARAVPNVSGGTVVKGSTFRIAATCYNLDAQQGCRVDYRPAGGSTWTTIGTYTYDSAEYYAQFTSAHYWDVTHLTPGEAYELRYVNIDASGQEDTEPPVVTIRRQIEDAAVVRVSAPSRLWPSQQFTLVVEVLNKSTQTWTPGAGYRLVTASGGVDALTGISSAALPDGLEVAPDTRAVYTLEATAPLVEGRYTTTWRHANPSGEAYGTAGSLSVTVGTAPLTLQRESSWMLY